LKPAPFSCYRTHSIPESVALLAEHGDGAKILAGGQGLVLMTNFRLARPAPLADLLPHVPHGVRGLHRLRGGRGRACRAGRRGAGWAGTGGQCRAAAAHPGPGTGTRH
jgi:aerobic carbon-monoxide dehydrogenase medium subunit